MSALIRKPSEPITIPKRPGSTSSGSTKHTSHRKNHQYKTLGHINDAARKEFDSFARMDLEKINKDIDIIDELLYIFNKREFEHLHNIPIEQLSKHYQEQKAFLTTKRDEITTFLKSQVEGGRRKRSTRKRSKRSTRK